MVYWIRDVNVYFEKTIKDILIVEKNKLLKPFRDPPVHAEQVGW